MVAGVRGILYEWWSSTGQYNYQGWPIENIAMPYYVWLEGDQVSPGATQYFGPSSLASFAVVGDYSWEMKPSWETSPRTHRFTVQTTHPDFSTYWNPPLNTMLVTPTEYTKPSWAGGGVGLIQPGPPNQVRQYEWAGAGGDLSADHTESPLAGTSSSFQFEGAGDPTPGLAYVEVVTGRFVYDDRTPEPVVYGPWTNPWGVEEWGRITATWAAAQLYSPTLPKPRAIAIGQVVPDIFAGPTTLKIRGWFGENLKYNDTVPVSFVASAADGATGTINAVGMEVRDFVNPGQTISIPAGFGRIIYEDIGNSTVCQTVEVNVEPSSDAVGIFDVTAGPMKLKRMVNLISRTVQDALLDYPAAANCA